MAVSGSCNRYWRIVASFLMAPVPHMPCFAPLMSFRVVRIRSPIGCRCRGKHCDPIHRVHRHLLAVDIHCRLCGCVELVPEWFHASAEIHGSAEVCAWCGVCTLDLVLNFIEEDTNKLELEDVLGGVEVGATSPAGWSCISILGCVTICFKHMVTQPMNDEQLQPAGEGGTNLYATEHILEFQLVGIFFDEIKNQVQCTNPTPGANFGRAVNLCGCMKPLWYQLNAATQPTMNVNGQQMSMDLWIGSAVFSPAATTNGRNEFVLLENDINGAKQGMWGYRRHQKRRYDAPVPIARPRYRHQEPQRHHHCYQVPHRPDRLGSSRPTKGSRREYAQPDGHPGRSRYRENRPLREPVRAVAAAGLAAAVEIHGSGGERRMRLTRRFAYRYVVTAVRAGICDADAEDNAAAGVMIPRLWLRVQGFRRLIC